MGYEDDRLEGDKLSEAVRLLQWAVQQLKLVEDSMDRQSLSQEIIASQVAFDCTMGRILSFIKENSNG